MMNARRVFEINGDFRDSPLIRSLRRLHRIFSACGASYAVIGGLAVVRNGAVRTTLDIDILTTKTAWENVRQNAVAEFLTRVDSATDRESGIDVDVLFAGREWEMVVPMPDPSAVREFDTDIGAWFVDLLHLIELKTAVYLKKKVEDGIEIAAKDLADIVELLRRNKQRIDAEFWDRLHRNVRAEVESIWNRVKNK